MAAQRGLALIAILEAVALFTGYSYLNKEDDNNNIGKLNINLDNPEVAIDVENIRINGNSISSDMVAGSFQAKHFDRQYNDQDAAASSTPTNFTRPKPKPAMDPAISDNSSKMMAELKTMLEKRKRNEVKKVDESTTVEPEIKKPVENLPINCTLLGQGTFNEGKKQFHVLKLPDSNEGPWKDGGYFIEISPKNDDATDVTPILYTDITAKLRSGENKVVYGKAFKSYNVYILSNTKFKPLNKILSEVIRIVQNESESVDELQKHLEENQQVTKTVVPLGSANENVKILIVPLK